MPEISLKEINTESPSILNVLSQAQLFESKGQIRRLITQGAVKLDGKKVNDADTDLSEVINESAIIKAGKKVFLRVIP